MNRKKLWLTAFVLALGGTVSFAQEQKIKEEGKIEFRPHWFMQVQAGAAHTVGEAKFFDLISPAAAVNIGYQFAPAWSARVADGRRKVVGLLHNKTTSINICKAMLILYQT